MEKSFSLFKSPEGRDRYISAYDAVLSKWDTPFKELDVATRFGDTHIIVSGPKDAFPLVLLHAANLSSTVWFPNIKELSRQFHTFAVDIIDNAGKSKPTTVFKTKEDPAVWLQEVLDGLCLDRVNIAGLSYGGWIALNFALNAPDRVNKLIMISPASPFVDFHQSFFFRLLPAAIFPAAPLIRYSLQAFFSKRFNVDKTFMAQMVAGMKYFRPIIEKGALPVPFSSEELKSLRIPAMLLLAKGEIAFDSQAAYDRALQFVPGVQAELWPDVGHALTMEQPEKANTRMLEFLLS